MNHGNILAVDPGATRAGWAVLGDYGGLPNYIASGVIHHPKLETRSSRSTAWNSSNGGLTSRST